MAEKDAITATEEEAGPSPHDLKVEAAKALIGPARYGILQGWVPQETLLAKAAEFSSMPREKQDKAIEEYTNSIILRVIVPALLPKELAKAYLAQIETSKELQDKIAAEVIKPLIESIQLRQKLENKEQDQALDRFSTIQEKKARDVYEAAVAPWRAYQTIAHLGMLVAGVMSFFPSQNANATMVMERSLEMARQASAAIAELDVNKHTMVFPKELNERTGKWERFKPNITAAYGDEFKKAAVDALRIIDPAQIDRKGEEIDKVVREHAERIQKEYDAYLKKHGGRAEGPTEGPATPSQGKTRGIIAPTKGESARETDEKSGLNAFCATPPASSGLKPLHEKECLDGKPRPKKTGDAGDVLGNPSATLAAAPEIKPEAQQVAMNITPEAKNDKTYEPPKVKPSLPSLDYNMNVG